MTLRGVLTLSGAVAGAVALSQFPEFSQQYLQRLAGQVDALEAVAADFDATAARNDLTRDAALAQMSGTAFLDDRQADLRHTFRRLADLQGDLALLRAATPLERMAIPQRMGDGAVLAAAWADFRPAVPVTADGAVAAGIGAVAGWGLMAGAVGIVAWPFRRMA